MKHTSLKLLKAWCMAFALMVPLGATQAQNLDQSLKTAQTSTQESAQVQESINSLDDERDNALREYRAILQQIEGLKLQIGQQEIFLKSQEDELAGLVNQFSRVDTIEQEILPMMRQMVHALEAFIDMDTPFLLDVRKERLARLKEALGNHALNQAERYRLILNAYEIEMGYGRGLAAWEGTLDTGEKVEFLRIGRLAFLHRKEDGSLFIWRKEKKGWETLPGRFALDISKAYRIAKEVTAPQLFLGPVSGAQAAQ